MVIDGKFLSVNEFFLSRIQKKFKFSFSIDPTLGKYANYCNQSLTFHQNCNVVWIGNWRKSSLKEICRCDAIFKFLQLKVNSKKRILINMKENITIDDPKESTFTDNNKKTMAMINQNFESSYEKYVYVIVNIHTNMAKRGGSSL